MLRAYKYRLYPNADQEKLIKQTMGCARLVYNLALQVKIDTYKANGVNITAYELCRQLTELKQYYEWMRQVDSQALQASVKKVDVTFKNFFRGSGYPKFKSKTGRQSFQCPNNTRKIDFENELLSIPKIFNIPVKVSRTFEGKIKTITISQETTGKYFASILVDNEKDLPTKNLIIESASIGIDVGIKDFAVLSDGTKISNPRHLKNRLKRLKCLQRRASRKKKGSNNRKKAVKKLALHHEKITNTRKDFLHKLSTSITKKYDTVCVEKLAVKNMVKNHKLAQAISDVGWATFITYCKYKQDWKGGNLLELPTFQASTKPCNDCGATNNTLTLSDREWTCANCGSHHDRDINAAKNIKDICLLQNSGWGTSGEPVELSPKGGTKKQESVAAKRVQGILSITK